MDINVKTIEQYIEDAKIKISLLATDIQTYEYRIEQTKKEINTLLFLINQYEKSIKLLEEGNVDLV